MIGTAKLFSVNAQETPPDYGVSITPAFLVRNVPNGNYVTPNFVANVVSAIGPVEYDWTVNGGTQFLSATNTQTVFLTVPGYNTEINLELRCVVTDTGNANAEVSATSEIILNFGSPL